MEGFYNFVSWALLVFGGLLCISGAVGLLRFPDFFTRMHAASVTDTLAAVMIFLGLFIQAEAWLVQVKLVMVLLFLLLTSPTAGHALAMAALHAGLQPLIPAKNIAKETGGDK